MKSPFVRVALVALALLLPVAAPAAPTKKAPAKATSAQTDWLATARRTSEGAIIIGNPAAKVRIVEYLSLTCSHCAELSGEALPPLKRDYIGKGLVSLEVRHAVRDGYDFVASLLLRCEPPARYLDSIEALYSAQADWMAKGSTAKTVAGFDAMTPDQKFATVAKSAGFESFFAKRGMTPKAYAACFADEKGKSELAQMAGNSWERDAIPGTPLILVNGVRQEKAKHWSDIEPLIQAALH